MRVVYQIQTINSINYITGWYACAPDEPLGVELDTQLSNVAGWFDGNGNPMWVLNADGSVGNVPIVVPPSSPKNSTPSMTMPDLLAQIPQEIIDIINAYVNGLTLTPDQVNAWNTAYTIHLAGTTQLSA